MRRIAFPVLSLLLLVALAGAGAAVWGHARFTRPGPLAVPATVVIPKGLGLAGIAERLREAGVIAEPLVFRIGARLTGAHRDLKAGEYAFSPAISMREVIVLLESGQTVVRRLTVVEGLTTAQVIAHLQSVDGLEGTVSPVPAEGSLLPETYHFSYGDSREQVVARMARAMRDLVADLWAARAPDLPLATPGEAVVLASLVEKETARPEERARVAAVFLNRLRKGMRLQSDPTVVYALTDGQGTLDRPLTRADLKVDSPFNTYLNDGLPPAPICNPGRASLVAALDPAATDDLYFVADGAGGHVFARTLAEHNRNVARWRARQEGAPNAPDGTAP